MNDNNAGPLVSVVMANHNGAAHIAAAVRSVLRQSERSLELILSDDGSTDDSLDIAATVAAGDPRLVVLRHDRQSGPAATRNRALEAARGRWIAVVDSDDFIHPERLARLVELAERDQADIVCDDLVTFYDDGSKLPHAHLQGALAAGPHWIDAPGYVRANVVMGGVGQPGYLKPLFRRTGLRYDESLTIGEDSDLVLRMLVGGARMCVYPELGYFYRKHSASISHRLSPVAIDRMLAAAERVGAGADRPLQSALQLQRNALLNARLFADLVDAIKRYDARAALRLAMQRPAALLLFKDAVVARLTPQQRRKPLGRRRVTLLTRRAVRGRDDADQAYLLATAETLMRAGMEVDYLGVSPAILDGAAIMPLGPETGVFMSYKVRGAVKLGPAVIALDPRLWLAALLRLLGQKQPQPAPANTAKAARAEMLFVARQAALSTRTIIVDGPDLTRLAPFALRPGAQVFALFADAAAADSALLKHADAVIARSPAAAAKARAENGDVILAPAPMKIAAVAHAGIDDTVFVDGGDAGWFMTNVWPLLLAQRPHARLLTANDVEQTAGAAADEARPWRQAGVVMVTAGADAGAALARALADGKAVAALSTVATELGEDAPLAMAVGDNAATLAQKLAALLASREQRLGLGRAALDYARQALSPEACSTELVTRLRGGQTPIGRRPALAAAQSN